MFGLAARLPPRAPVYRRILVIVACIAFPCLSHAETPISNYQVDLGPAPTTVADALNTRSQRETIALAATACGREVSFLSDAKKQDSGEDIVNRVLAKVAWVTSRPQDGRCVFDVNMPLNFDAETFSNEVATFFGQNCAHVTTSVLREPASAIEISENIVADHLRVRFVVSNRCLKDQINQTILAMSPKGQLGSGGLPCHLVDGTTEGDWDVSVRDLVRIYYLSKSRGAVAPDGQILEPQTEEHLFNELLTVDGAPGPDDYPFTGCGNGERSTGSAADRADERSWGEENFGWLGDVWDVLKWILLAILIILLILATIFTLGAPAAAWAIVPVTIAKIVAVVAIVLVVIAAVYLSVLRVPETENHLLMINTSRYLINQIIIDAHPPDVRFFVDDQKQVKQWLLLRLQRIATHDFDEYNARPYQRYSIIAILNLHDFTRCNQSFLLSGPTADCDLQTASQIVLDLATAKFAAGSNEGRRVAPFRRLLSLVEDDIGDRKRLTDASNGTDYMFGFMMAYAGHTQQLPDRKAEYGAAAEMIYPATSSYAPAPAVMSVALGEVGTFEQRIRHDGIELYSRTPSFLISAGGVRTPSATPITLGSFQFGERCVDRGAGLPTVLIPTGGGYHPFLDGKMTSAVRRDDFLRIEGFYYFYKRKGLFDCLGPNNSALSGPPAIPSSAESRDETWSHDDNVCVYKGFACGTNIVVPEALKSCFSGEAGTPWAFLRSTTCEALANTKPFHVALFRKPCPTQAENCLRNWGFFEAVEAPPAADPAAAAAAFQQFRTKTLAVNGATLTPDPPSGDEPPLAGTYVTFSGQRIDFDAAATMNDEDRPGVENVDGVSQPALDTWPFASGAVINSTICLSSTFPFFLPGQIEISGQQKSVTIDFCESAHPKRTPH